MKHRVENLFLFSILQSSQNKERAKSFDMMVPGFLPACLSSTASYKWSVMVPSG